MLEYRTASLLQPTLAEAIRFTGQRVASAVVDDAGSSELFLREWVRVLGRHGLSGFAERLRQDDVDLGGVLDRIEPSADSAGRNGGGSLLEAFLCSELLIAGSTTDTLDSVLTSTPFGHIALRAVMLGEKLLLQRLRRIGAKDVISVTGYDSLRSILTTRIVVLLTKAVDASVLKGSGARLASILTEASHLLHKSRLQEFRDTMLLARPVLRAIIIVLEQWIDNTELMIRRLLCDRALLQELGGESTRRSPIVLKVEDTLSDPHRNGASVLLLDLGWPKRLYYKPRPSQSEFLLFSLIRDFSDKHGLGLTAPKVLSRGSYGWAIQVSVDSGEVATSQLLVQTGKLLAILYALKVEDVHVDNIRVSNGEPILIDGEVFGHSGRDLCLAQNAPSATEPYSVRDTGILPGTYLIRVGSVEVDIGFIRNNSFDNREHSSCMDSGVCISAKQQAEALKNGFRQVYEIILTEKASGAFIRRLRRVKSLRSRLLFRATANYRLLLDTSFAYSLHSVARWSLCFERLANTFLGLDRPELGWNIFKSEVRQLERLNIPVFYVDLGTGAIYDDQSSQVASTSPSPWCLLEHHLSKLGKEDMINQMSFIDESFFALTPNP